MLVQFKLLLAIAQVAANQIKRFTEYCLKLYQIFVVIIDKIPQYIERQSLIKMQLSIE